MNDFVKMFQIFNMKHSTVTVKKEKNFNKTSAVRTLTSEEMKNKYFYYQLEYDGQIFEIMRKSKATDFDKLKSSIQPVINEPDIKKIRLISTEPTTSESAELRLTEMPIMLFSARKNDGQLATVSRKSSIYEDILFQILSKKHMSENSENPSNECDSIDIKKGCITTSWSYKVSNAIVLKLSLPEPLTDEEESRIFNSILELLSDDTY